MAQNQAKVQDEPACKEIQDLPEGFPIPNDGAIIKVPNVRIQIWPAATNFSSYLPKQ